MSLKSLSVQLVHSVKIPLDLIPDEGLGLGLPDYFSPQYWEDDSLLLTMGFYEPSYPVKTAWHLSPERAEMQRVRRGWNHERRRGHRL